MKTEGVVRLRFHPQMNSGKEGKEGNGGLVEPFQLFSCDLSVDVFDLLCAKVCEYLDPRGYKEYNLSPDKEPSNTVSHSQSELGALIVLNQRCAARIPDNGVIWQYAFAHFFSPWCFLQFPALDETKSSYNIIFGPSYKRSSWERIQFVNRISKKDKVVSKNEALELLDSVRELLILAFERFSCASGDYYPSPTICTCGGLLEGNLLPMLQASYYKDVDFIKILENAKNALTKFSLRCSNGNCALDLSIHVKTRDRLSCPRDHSLDEEEGEYLRCDDCHKIRCGRCRTTCAKSLVDNLFHCQNICVDCSVTCGDCGQNVCQSHGIDCEECGQTCNECHVEHQDPDIDY